MQLRIKNVELIIKQKKTMTIETTIIHNLLRNGYSETRISDHHDIITATMNETILQLSKMNKSPTIEITYQSKINQISDSQISESR